MVILFYVLVTSVYLIGAYYSFNLHKDDEVDVFADVTYQRLAFFFGLMVILFFSLLFMKITGANDEEE